MNENQKHYASERSQTHILLKCNSRTNKTNLWLKKIRSSCRGAVEMNPTRSHEVAGLIPGLTQWLRIWHRDELWCRSHIGLDPVLLWLWCRSLATAPIGPLAWEPPNAMGSGPRKGKKTKKKRTQNVSRMLPCV